MGGGFIQFLFARTGQGGQGYQQPTYQQQPAYGVRQSPLPPRIAAIDAPQESG